MPKRLVLCCDGTWNTPDQRTRGQVTPTNVTKVAVSLSDRDADGREQRLYYQSGVGTRPHERLRGGTFGFGLSRNVTDTYRFLVQNFTPGDELFFFGFSRGAFTARSTVGFIRKCGILRPEHAHRVDEAYTLYRNRNNITHPRRIESTLFRRSYSHETRIRFIGVWDTVGALGIPFKTPLSRWLNRRYLFHDTDLSGWVDSAYQALAIDEKRGPFRPTLWTRQSDPPRHQTFEQVWFSGVHSDVGGGYEEHELSDIPLLWMVDRAESCGLAFDPTAFPERLPGGKDDETPAVWTRVHPDPLGEIHESRTGFYRLIRPYIRHPGASPGDHEYVSSSAVDRQRTLQPTRSAYLATGQGTLPTMPVPLVRPDRRSWDNGPTADSRS